MKIALPIEKRRVLQILLLTISLLLTTMTLNANVVIQHNSPSNEPIRTIEVSNNVITVCYDFSEITEVADENGALRHAITGFGFCYDEGYPQIPVRIDTFKIPEGFTASVNSSRTNKHQIECEYIISTGLTTDTSETSPLHTKYPTSTVNKKFPDEIATIQNQYTFRNENLIDVQVCPVQYDPLSKLATYSDKISYSITVVPVSNQISDLLSSTENSTTATNLNIEYLLKDALITNINNVGNTLSVDAFGYEGTVGYIIVTTDKYIEYAQEFAKWKKYLGYTPYVISKELWNDWTEVRTAVLEKRRNDPAIQYILILGDQEDVPAKISNYYDNHASHNESHPTDTYFGVTDSNNYIPEVFIGRISVKTTNEAHDVLHKLMRLEMCPIMDEDYYNNVIQASYFEYAPNSNMQTENTRFVLTSEEIKSYIESQGKTAKRVYNCATLGNPKYYSSSYAYGQQIPFELQKPQFSWNGSATDCLNLMNAGALYTMYRAHGSSTSWANIGFGTSTSAFLKNNELPSTIFSITCNTGIFNLSNMDCLAEALLKRSNGGASSVIAASNVSYSGLNDSFAEGMIDAIWPEPGLYPNFGGFPTTSPSKSNQPLYRLGNIMSQGLFRMKESWAYKPDLIKYQYEIFHLFGDPSMYFHTDNPTPIKNVQILRLENEIVVTTDEDQVSIGFFDPVSDKASKIEDRGAVYSTNHPKDVVVCITGHNKLTYLDGIEVPVPAIDEYENNLISCNLIDNSTAEIKVNFSYSQNPLLSLIDMHGQIVYESELKHSIENQSTLISLPSTKGVYIVVVKDNSKIVATKKIVKK